ncbi:MAG: hypothetical protein P4L61_00295 [Candidatus Pacebacteria bacterium]|nr:hypothetical protein [Candidatus Paceibacterota bacterium]
MNIASEGCVSMFLFFGAVWAICIDCELSRAPVPSARANHWLPKAHGTVTNPQIQAHARYVRMMK